MGGAGRCAHQLHRPAGDERQEHCKVQLAGDLFGNGAHGFELLRAHAKCGLGLFALEDFAGQLMVCLRQFPRAPRYLLPQVVSMSE
jgi:hypothetical protein